MTTFNPRYVRRLPYFLLALTLATTVLVTLLTIRSVERDKRLRFESESQNLTSLIQRRLDTYQDMARSIRSLFLSSAIVTKRQFATFVDSFEISRRYPGVQSLGYASKVLQGDLVSFETLMSQLNVENFSIFPEGKRALYYPITHIAPPNALNRDALGWDLWNPTLCRLCSAAMQASADRGEIIATEALSLLPGQVASGKQKGFQIFVPLYTPDAPLLSLENRRDALIGFAFLTFKMDEFVAGLLGNQKPKVALEIFDGRIAPEQLLYRDFVSEETLGPDSEIHTLDTMGRTWILSVHSLKDGSDTLPWVTVWIVVGMGLTISLLIFSLTFAQANARVQAEQFSTRLQNSQAALNRTRAEFETMFSAMADVAVLFDTKGHIIRSNAALWITFGLNPERFKGHSITELYFDERPQRASRFRARYRRTDSSTFMGEAHRSAVYSTSGEIIGYVEIIRDITESLAAAEALENALAMQRTFLAETSHELRTPLTAILGYVRRAHREIGEGAPARASLEDAIRVGENMTRLVSDLLQLSRGELVQEYIPHFVDLNRLLEQIARDHGVHLALDPNAMEILGDPQKLSQMLGNLISNAIRVCGDPNLITLKARLEHPDKVVLEIADRGPGVPDDIKEKIFDKFFRGKEAGSAGLGLTISQQIAQMHGSRITVHDTPGGGATFRVVLDALSDEDAE